MRVATVQRQVVRGAGRLRGPLLRPHLQRRSDFNRLSIGRAPESLKGILITHEHSDHIQGLVGLAAKLQIPIYCNRLTRDAIAKTA